MLPEPNPDGSFPIVSREEIGKAKEIIRLNTGVENLDPEYIRSYAELLKAAEEKMRKDKANIIMPRNPAVNVPVPDGMTTDSYKEMNLVAGHRVGWDYKQEYLAKLGEMYAEGYITEAEHDKRVEWVNAAQTSEQIDVAFTDLQKAMLDMKMKEYSLPETAKKKFPPSRAQAPFSYVWMIYMLIVGTILSLTGAWVGAGIFFTYFVIILLVNSIIRRKRNR